MADVVLDALKVRNFLSLREVDIALGKLSVLVGPNASGKSNVSKALRLVSAHVRGVPPDKLGYRSFSEMTYNFDSSLEIQISMEFSINGERARYNLYFTEGGYREEVVRDGEKILESSSSSSQYRYLTGDGSYTSRTLTRYIKYFGADATRSPLAELPLDASPVLHTISSVLKSMKAFSFSPVHLRGWANVRDSPDLGYHGERLARVILHLYLEDRERFARIEETMKSLVPEVREVVPHLEGDSVEIWVREEGLRKPLKPHAISDGTLRLLAFVTALYTSQNIVVFEEPENCVHPHLLETLVDLMRKTPPQVIVTTHSPYLLDHLKPEEVLVVEKVKGETQITRLVEHSEIERVKLMLAQGITLGEIWHAKVFGATP